MLPIYAHAVRATHGSTVHLPRSHTLKTASAFPRGHQPSLDLSLGWDFVSSSSPHAGMLPGLACEGSVQSSTAALCSRVHWSRQVALLPAPPPPRLNLAASLPSPLQWSHQVQKTLFRSSSPSPGLWLFQPLCLLPAVVPELWKRRDNDVAFAVEHPLALFLRTWSFS